MMTCKVRMAMKPLHMGGRATLRRAQPVSNAFHPSVSRGMATSYGSRPRPSVNPSYFNVPFCLVVGYIWLQWQAVPNDPKRARYMFRTYTTSPSHLKAGLYWSLVTSLFSHSSLFHLAANTLAIVSVTPVIVPLIGVGPTWLLFLGSGVLSNYAQVKWTEREMQGRSELTFSQGASGGAYALFSFFACLAPKSQLALFFVLPVPASFAIALAGTYEAVSLYTGLHPSLGHAAHLTGLLTGVASFIVLRRPLQTMIRRRQF